MLRDGRLFGRTTQRFTLQWHLTSECGGACRHCYDRTSRPSLDLAAAQAVVAELAAFGRDREIRVAISLTGGDPLRYPHFFPLYRAIAAAGIEVSLLGNPIAEDELAMLVAIARPRFYQLSLEGRAPYDDAIRGPGHFAAALAFLARLATHGVRRHVMLTLSAENLGEVEPLAVALEGRAERFYYNRLAQVGGGATLAQPTPEAYARFMAGYLRLARRSPMVGLKDNLLNIARFHFGARLAGGCTGHGCGAAFDFVALLPDGEVHACRKLPSPIGHVLGDGLAAAYDSAAAAAYRLGCHACFLCPIRNVCGGCLAVGHGMGRDAFAELDPHCFFAERHEWLTAARAWADEAAS